MSVSSLAAHLIWLGFLVYSYDRFVISKHELPDELPFFSQDRWIIATLLLGLFYWPSDFSLGLLGFQSPMYLLGIGGDFRELEILTYSAVGG